MPPPSREDRATLVGRLYDAHGAAMYRYALMLLRRRAAAEDAVQQVFTSVLRQSGAIDNEAHYLRRAVRNECFSAMRRDRHLVASDEPTLELAAPGEIDVAERMALETALASLPPEQREVVHLHIFEGMTFEETARVVDQPMNTVASRYRYALAKMRTHLA